MPAPLSNDLRIRIVEARAQDEATYEMLAERFAVGRASVDRVLRLARETGSVEPAPHGGGAPKRIQEAEQAVLTELVRARPDATLEELCIALEAQTGVSVSRSTMSRELRSLGLTRKKSPSWRKSAARLTSQLIVRRSSASSTAAIRSG